MIVSRYESTKRALMISIENINKSITKHEKLLKEAKENGNQKLLDQYQRILNDLHRKKEKIEGKFKYIRPDIEEDLSTRADIKIDYARQIREVIPSSVPIVFHGRPNIDTVEKIIQDGGLTTPDERGEDFRSFATQIDVSTAQNILATLDFAEPGIGSGLPYGAIFVFWPCDDEASDVLDAIKSSSTELECGVRSVNFRENPERLIAIVTTDENIERIKTWCKKYKLDSNKVFTHNDFIIECRKKFSESINPDLYSKNL